MEEEEEEENEPDEAARIEYEKKQRVRRQKLRDPLVQQGEDASPKETGT